jgi:hypothetical protein
MTFPILTDKIQDQNNEEIFWLHFTINPITAYTNLSFVCLSQQLLCVLSQQLCEQKSQSIIALCQKKKNN